MQLPHVMAETPMFMPVGTQGEWFHQSELPIGAVASVAMPQFQVPRVISAAGSLHARHAQPECIWRTKAHQNPNSCRAIVMFAHNAKFCVSGSVKGLTPAQMEELGCHVILGNTYHLENRPGSELVIVSAPVGVRRYHACRYCMSVFDCACVREVLLPSLQQAVQLRPSPWLSMCIRSVAMHWPCAKSQASQHASRSMPELKFMAKPILICLPDETSEVVNEAFSRRVLLDDTSMGNLVLCRSRKWAVYMILWAGSGACLLTLEDSRYIRVCHALQCKTPVCAKKQPHVSV
jgi:hypothetical protein